MFLGPRHTKKNVLNLREITSAICFCQANLLVGVCLLLLHDYLRQMMRKLQSCSCSSVIVGFVACLQACVSFRTEAKDWSEEEFVFIPISVSHKLCLFKMSSHLLFQSAVFFSPPAQSCRKSSFGQDWLPVQEVHQPQICPAEIKPSWGAIFNAKVAVVEIYSILYKLYIYIYQSPWRVSIGLKLQKKRICFLDSDFCQSCQQLFWNLCNKWTCGLASAQVQTILASPVSAALCNG